MASNNKVASHSQMESGDQMASNQHPGSTEYQLRKYLLLLATLVATVTYVAGLNLPGGAWQEDTQDGRAGDPILEVAHYRRYLTFYYCNATSFAASLVVSLLLVVLDGTNTGWEAFLRVVMVLDLLGLMGSYVAGSCRDLFTTIYSAVLVSAVFAYIVLAFSSYLISNYWWLPMALQKKQGEDTEKQDGRQGEDTGTHEREELHEVLMLLATFAVTITYGAGLNPPGGFWGDTKDDHHMSDPILQYHYSSRYQAFFVCNTTAFVASLVIIILLVDKKLSSNLSVRFVALYGLIITALFGLMGAYAAGSCREVDDTTYVVCLIGGVLAYIFLQVAITKAIKMKERCCCFKVLATIYSSASECLQNIMKFFDRSQNRTERDQTSSRNTKREAAVEKARSLVLLLATLVVSITYQAGLDPPGGLWPKDGDGHNNGDPILLTTHPTRYKVFFYSNSAAFVASLIVIIMVQSRFLLKRHTLEAVMILDLFGLISAYAAGSCRDESTSIYVVALAGVVLVYVVIHIIFFTLDNKDNHRDAEKLENRREVLLLLAILAATLTYQAGLTPPGGFWSDNNGHHAGFPVLRDNYPPHYNAFFYCNAASFMASVALIVLLVNPNLYKPGIRCYALYVCMVVGMFGLMGAYAAGSSRDLRTSIYVLTLVVAVFAFVALEVAIFWIYPYLQLQKLLLKLGGSSNKEEGSSGQQGGDITKPKLDAPNQDAEIQEGDPPVEKPETQKETESRDKDIREYLMLLGVLAASVTYQTAFKPPGGLWQDNGNDHYAGYPILHSINKRRYHAFFYSNSTSFMASIVVIILLLPWTLHKHKLPLWPIQTAILFDMLGLLGAYAAGSTRDWETSRNVIYLVIPVLAYIAAYAAVSLFRKQRRSHK
ncbi:uncharacterized protein LOC133926684 [Phragmites australis]|uniref:uncharacterized protein LOC133926684 n=1 Tax=Phragmites australis TaxID=29695 RepID=UPI002D7A05A0|nr:uncharacterized protein LOC133926684 [Phragmites australis]